MTTRILDRQGKVKSETDTGYHKDGTGPRDPSGKALRETEDSPPVPAAPAPAEHPRHTVAE